MKHNLRSILLTIVIFVVVMFSCKENDTKKQTLTSKNDLKKIEKKATDDTKTLTWKLGDHDLRAYFNEFKKYGSFEGNAKLNTSYFINLVSKDCQITSHYDSKNLKQDITQPPLDYAYFLGHIAFTSKVTEFVLEEPTYMIKENKALLSYVSGYCEENTTDYYAIKRELTIEIIVDKLKASSILITITDATQKQIDKINQQINELQKES